MAKVILPKPTQAMPIRAGLACAISPEDTNLDIVQVDRCSASFGHNRDGWHDFQRFQIQLLRILPHIGEDDECSPASIRLLRENLTGQLQCSEDVCVVKMGIKAGTSQF